MAHIVIASIVIFYCVFSIYVPVGTETVQNTVCPSFRCNLQGVFFLINKTGSTKCVDIMYLATII
jgi:hypothetical protein